VDVQMKESVFGFHGNKKRKFLHVTVTQHAMIGRAKRVLESGLSIGRLGHQVSDKLIVCLSICLFVRSSARSSVAPVGVLPKDVLPIVVSILVALVEQTVPIHYRFRLERAHPPARCLSATRRTSSSP
jgi:hypothetical protein